MLAGGLLAGGYVYRVLAPALASASVAVKAPRVAASRGGGAGAGARRGAARFRAGRIFRLAADRPAARHGGSAMNGAGTLGPVLLVATLATPLVLLLACLSRRLRDSMPALLVLAPLPGLAAALLAIGGTPLGFDQPQLQDQPGARRAGRDPAGRRGAALECGRRLCLHRLARPRPNGARFAVCWLLTLTGSLGVFIAADLLGFYLFFAAGQPARLWTDRARR